MIRARTHADFTEKAKEKIRAIREICVQKE